MAQSSDGLPWINWEEPASLWHSLPDDGTLPSYYMVTHLVVHRIDLPQVSRPSVISSTLNKANIEGNTFHKHPQLIHRGIRFLVDVTVLSQVRITP